MTQPKRLSEEELEKMKSIHRETPLTGDGFGWGFVAKLFEHIQALESEHKREVEGLREKISYYETPQKEKYKV